MRARLINAEKKLADVIKASNDQKERLQAFVESMVLDGCRLMWKRVCSRTCSANKRWKTLGF